MRKEKGRLSIGKRLEEGSKKGEGRPSIGKKYAVGKGENDSMGEVRTLTSLDFSLFLCERVQKELV